MKTSYARLADRKNGIWSMFYLGAIGLLFLAGFSGNAKPSWAQTTVPTVIDIGTTVQHADVKRLGINLSGQLYYDSAQILRQLTFNNPGFEGQIWQSVLTCTAVKGTTCTDGNGWSQWPANFLQGGTYTFIYGSAKGKTGTLAGMTAPSGNGGAPAWYDFGNVSPAVGDYFIIKKSMPGNPAAGWWTYLNGGGTITADTTDLSPETPGVQAISLNANGANQSVEVQSNFDSTPGRSFLQMNGTYTISFRAKCLAGSNQLNVSVVRLNTSRGNVQYFNQNVSLTNQWQDYSYTFSASEDGTYIGTASLSFTIAGGQVLLDDASLTESASSSNKTPFRDAVVQRLQELNPGVLRYMDSGYDFGSSIDNMIAVPDARQRTGFGQGSAVATQVPMGLEEFLQLCQAIGAEPWYTMPMGISPTEMQNLIEFLAGDASTPYGAKRAALGQTAPWTSVFPVIHLELGDEAWNAAFSGDSIINAYAYGSRVATIFGAARASSSYGNGNFDLIMDGWANVPWWGQQAMNSASNMYDTIDAAPYTFYGFTEFGSNEEIFGSMFAEPEGMDSRPGGVMYSQMQMVTGATSGLTGKQPNLAIYEVNLSTTSGTAPQAILDETIPSLGAGLSTAEHMLLMMRDDGVQLQTLFALPGFENGLSDPNATHMQLWGTVVDMGGQYNCSRPQFLAEELANTAIGGNMLAVTQSGGDPTWDEASSNDNINFSNGINVQGAHYIQSFAFNNGTQNSLILFNLSRDTALPVTFSGANAPSGQVQVGLLTSANMTDTNENGSVVAIKNSTIANFNPSATINLPPYSMTVYQWASSGGGGAPTPVLTSTTLTASPTSATAGQTVTLTAKVVAPSKSSEDVTGNVNFYDGGKLLGSQPLSGGQAALSVNTLASGSHSITAKYLGSTSFDGSTSAATVVSIATGALISTSTVLHAPSQVTLGNSISLTAFVGAVSGAVPTGTVTFKYGGTILGTASLTAGKAMLVVPVASVKLGTYSITATYSGNSSDAASTSSSVSVEVVADTTTTSLTLSGTQVIDGATLAVTANVTPVKGSVPTGTVNFYLGANMTTLLGSATLSDGKAIFNYVTNLALGNYQIKAVYTGTADDDKSTSAAAYFSVVAKIATVTDLTLSATQIAEGGPVQLNASVTPAQGVTATGAVTFYIGKTALGTGELADGRAAIKVPANYSPGKYELTAVYTGNTADASSTSSAVSLTITADVAATTTQLTAGRTSLVEGQDTILTSKVAASGSNTTPTGTVDFYLNGSKIASSTLTAGTASYTLDATMSPGTYEVTATYTGSSLDSASSSAPVAIQIAPSVVATSISITPAATQVTEGQNLALAAKVAPASGSSVATGTVNFYLGATKFGSSTLSGGIATYTLDATMAPGTYQITAAYAGDGQDAAATSSPVLISVLPATAATSMTLSASATQIQIGNPVTLQATVTAIAGSSAPVGSVSFYLGNTLLGTAIVQPGQGASAATLVQTFTNLAPGTYQLTSTFSPSGSFAPAQSNAVSIVVQSSAQAISSPTPSGSFTLGLSSNKVSLTPSQTASLQVTIAPIQGYTGSIQLGCAGLPAGVSCDFSPALLAVHASTANSTLFLSTPKNTAYNSPIISNVAQCMLLPWDMASIFGFIFSPRRKRGAGAFISLSAALLCTMLWMTGCGLTINNVTKSYHVTVTATGSNNLQQTTTLTLTVTEPAATF